MSSRSLLILCLICIAGRVLPHPANMTPVHALSFLAGVYLPMGWALCLLFLSNAYADIILAYFYDFSAFGSWSFYTYSGLLGLISLGNFANRARLRFTIGLAGTVFFWLWTNMGVWLHSGLYASTIEGLLSCYIAALPFLQKSLLGDGLWFLIFFGFLSRLNPSIAAVTLNTDFARAQKVILLR